MVPWWMGLAAMAQDAVTLEVVQTTQAGGNPPALIVRPQVDATSLHVEVRCAADHQERSGPASAGERIALTFDVPVGTHACTGRLEGVFADGTAGEMPLSFEIRVLPSLYVQVTSDDLDLDARHLDATVTQPVERLDLVVYGPGGLALGRGSTSVGAAAGLGPHRIEWGPESEGEIVQLRVTAIGVSGVETELDLFPWSYAVPHEDVVFATNRHDIGPAEASKLDEALQRIGEVLDKYGQGVGGFPVPIQLYVGGYTDTVGSQGTNQPLSERRARSIAAWFRNHGFPRPIYVQGFGERGLMVQTADGVDNPNNRRSAYILSAEAPPVSEHIPGKSWQRLR
jgi:hypothetical protein